MRIEQVYEIMNEVTQEILGAEVMVEKDLSNIVDIGKEIIGTDNVEHYAKKVINKVGKSVFVDRPYSGGVPSLLMDAWEFGSILEKVSCEMPEAEENPSANLIDRQSVDNQIFYQPKINAKFFNSLVTFEVPMSFAEKYIKESFINATALNSFFSMIYTSIENTITLKMDSLIMMTINNMTAETILDAYPTLVYTTEGNARAVNLLAKYNNEFGTSITKELAIKTPEFIRYCALYMRLYVDRLTRMSTLFNVGEKARFTPSQKLHIVMHSEFKSSADIYLQSDTFNKEMTKFPDSESVAYWQATGTDYSFENTSKIHVMPSSDNTKEIELDGILCVMFDRNACGVSNLDRRIKTAQNARGEFVNQFYKFDAGYYNDTDENFVVFFIQ